GLRDGIERRAQGMRVVARDDALRGEHPEMGVMNRHQRREKQLLGVLEVFVEDILDVLRSNTHGRRKYTDYFPPRIHRSLCSSRSTMAMRRPFADTENPKFGAACR